MADSETEVTVQRMWSGKTSEFVNAHTTNAEIDVLRDKAAALDKILASWGGMTWEQYQGKGEACSQSGNT